MTKKVSSKTPLIGKFFERRIATLLGLSDWQSEDVRGDLRLNGRPLIVVEVKASDNNHHFRISFPQLKRYLEVERFPLNGCIYCLIGYRNRQGKATSSGKRKSLLAKCKTLQDIEIFLAKNMDSIYLLDVCLLEAISIQHGFVKGTMPFQPYLETVVLKRNWLQELINYPQETLSGLGLNHRSWQIKQQQMNMSLNLGLFGRVSPEIKVVYAVRRKFIKDVRGTIENSKLLTPTLVLS